MTHIAKHLTHVALIVSALVVLRLADVEMSTVGLVGLMAACLVAFEGGLWLIHRREATAGAAADDRAGASPLA